MGNYWMKEGEEHIILDYIKNHDIYMGLLTAPAEVNLTEDMTIGDITEATEVSAGNYERVLLSKSNWLTASLEGQDGSGVYQDWKQFTLDADETILGYFLVNAEESAEQLLSVVYFAVAKEMVADQIIKVKPYIYVD